PGMAHSVFRGGLQRSADETAPRASTTRAARRGLAEVTAAWIVSSAAAPRRRRELRRIPGRESVRPLSRAPRRGLVRRAALGPREHLAPESPARPGRDT